MRSPSSISTRRRPRARSSNARPIRRHPARGPGRRFDLHPGLGAQGGSRQRRHRVSTGAGRLRERPYRCSVKTVRRSRSASIRRAAPRRGTSRGWWSRPRSTRPRDPGHRRLRAGARRARSGAARGSQTTQRVRDLVPAGNVVGRHRLLRQLRGRPGAGAGAGHPRAAPHGAQPGLGDPRRQGDRLLHRLCRLHAVPGCTRHAARGRAGSGWGWPPPSSASRSVSPAS